MIRTRTLGGIAAVAVFLLVSSVASARGLRIGVVNMKRAVSETKEGKRANEEIKRLKKKLEAELNRKLKELYEEQARMQKAMSILKARLYEMEESRRRAAQESLLSQASARFSQSLNVDAVLQMAVRELGQLAGVSEVSVQLSSESPFNFQAPPSGKGNQ